MNEPPMPQQETGLMKRLQGRDMVSTYKIAQKVNEIIEKLEEMANELVANGALKKE